MIITKNNIKDIYRSTPCNIEIMELKGYKMIHELFADSSGFGYETEPALTPQGLETVLTGILENTPKVHAYITRAGMFQVYIGLFIKEGKNKLEKIGGNCYRIDKGNGSYTVKFYDTNILEYNGGQYTLNNGGYYTNTTKKWINLELPSGYFVNQKAGEWFLNTPGGEKIKFENDKVSFNL